MLRSPTRTTKKTMHPWNFRLTFIFVLYVLNNNKKNFHIFSLFFKPSFLSVSYFDYKLISQRGNRMIILRNTRCSSSFEYRSKNEISQKKWYSLSISLMEKISQKDLQKEETTATKHKRNNKFCILQRHPSMTLAHPQ